MVFLVATFFRFGRFAGRGWNFALGQWEFRDHQHLRVIYAPSNGHTALTWSGPEVDFLTCWLPVFFVQFFHLEIFRNI